MFWKTAGVWLESSGKRHTSRDCWYPDYRDVGINCHPWPVDSGAPPAIPDRGIPRRNDESM
ncbi:MAG: hypothetical protein ACXWTL_08995 [Methylobacter sp.]